MIGEDEMIYKGIIKGRMIELEEELHDWDGRSVVVSVELWQDIPIKGSPAAVLQAAQAPPHVRFDVVDEMEYWIQEGRLPLSEPLLFSTDEAEWSV
jgi:hypothetical protein